MQELSDGDLPYMIHFDQTNFTPKWIQQAEREAKRRRLTLHVINDEYRANVAAKTIESDIELEHLEPRTWQKKLYPFIVTFTAYSIYKTIKKGKVDVPDIIFILGLIGFSFYLWRNSKGKYQEIKTDTSSNKIAQ